MSAALAPLLVVTVLYVAQAAGYIRLERPGMALAFAGYAVANLGLLWDSLTR